MTGQVMRVGELRPNQLLHTYGVGAVADLPNLSVVIAGLDDWDLVQLGHRDRAAPPRGGAGSSSGPQVETLRTPPYKPETV